MSTFIDIYTYCLVCKKMHFYHSLSGYNMIFLDLSAFRLGLVWDYQVKISYIYIFFHIWPYIFLLQEEQGRRSKVNRKNYVGNKNIETHRKRKGDLLKSRRESLPKSKNAFFYTSGGNLFFLPFLISFISVNVLS